MESGRNHLDWYDRRISIIVDRASVQQLAIVNGIEVRSGGEEAVQKNHGEQDTRSNEANSLLYDLDKFFNANVVAQQIAHDVSKLAARLLFQQLAQIRASANYTAV